MESVSKEVVQEFELFGKNYRDEGGNWKTVRMTAGELTALREKHREHCRQIWKECYKDFPDNNNARVAMFQQRADKIFTWISAFLDEKVRIERTFSNSNGNNKHY